MMRITWKVLCVALFVLIPQLEICGQRIVADSVKLGGVMRHFQMFLPEGLSQQAPLVFVLHGYGNEGDVNTWMNDAAKKHHFAVCVPQGLIDPNHHHSWNVGYPFQEGWKIDDVKTMCALAAFVQKKYALSRENTFLTGMSNGGEMCYLLAYSRQHTFKALGSLAGLTLEWMYRDLEATSPVPFLEIHGTEDRTSEWYGDLANAGGWGAYLSVPIAVGYLVAKNRCTELKVDTLPAKAKRSKREIILHQYNNLQTHNDVWLYEVVGAPHCWFTDDMDTGEYVWRFFRRYIK